jgi:hypothetical protein
MTGRTPKGVIRILDQVGSSRRPPVICSGSSTPARDMTRFTTSVHLRAAAAFAALAIVFSWPLPAHLTTRLLGPVGSDLGVYAWNLWVFSHEVVEDHHLPLFTSAIFSLDWQADLSLHNYTIFADLVAVPLLPLVGVVCAFNLVYLGTIVLNGYAMFLLARHLGAGDREALLGGVLFAFSPCLIARSAEHLSLFMAAPVVLFVLALHRLDAGARPVRTASAAGAAMAWAAFCDPYYGVYCAVLAVWHVLSRAGRVERAHRAEGERRRAGSRTLEAAIALTGLLCVWIATTGGWSGRIAGIRLEVRTLYTPVLLLTVLVAARAAVAFRPRLSLTGAAAAVRLIRLVPYGSFTCALLVSPLLYALGRRVMEGRFVSAPVFWRTSMPGIDLLSFVVPNPNHPWFRGLSEHWLTAQSGGFVENVASVPLIALLVIAGVAWRLRWRVPRYWMALAVVGVGITVGPFLRVAGVFTYVPTPWTLLRYVPLLGSARSPARFMVVVMVAVSVLFALALRALGDRWPYRRSLILGLVALVLLFELLPAPRRLYSAEIPSVYDQIAADPRPVRVLELPFGVRDGLSSFGNFTAASQYYQTYHHKRLIGGYLSRVSHRRVDAVRQRPILYALMGLSEGRPVPDAELGMLRVMAPLFIRRARLGYVVVDRTRASDDLVRFAIDTLGLEKVASSPGRDLYRPRLQVGFPGHQMQAAR